KLVSLCNKAMLWRFVEINNFDEHNTRRARAARICVRTLKSKSYVRRFNSQLYNSNEWLTGCPQNFRDVQHNNLVRKNRDIMRCFIDMRQQTTAEALYKINQKILICKKVYLIEKITPAPISKFSHRSNCHIRTGHGVQQATDCIYITSTKLFLPLLGNCDENRLGRPISSKTNKNIDR
ncbi:hypothetical protein L9F63_017492, partial [Diploptera punctata]